MHAEISETIVPAIIALNPNSDKFFLCDGAKTPIPPIGIPIEVKFANPHNMNVAIVIDFLLRR